VKKNSAFLVSLCFLLASVLTSCDDSEITYWDVIDQNSILVFETIHVPTIAQQLLIPYLKVSSTTFAVSLQNISKNESDLLYSYSIPEKEFSILINDSTLNQGNHKRKSRFYSGFEIREIRDEVNSILFAFAYIKGVFVMSESVLLIENAIRVFENKDGINFKVKNRDLFQFASIKSDEGNLFVNYSQISGTLLAGSNLRKTIPFMANLAESSMLDVKVEPNLVSMSGFTLDSANTQGLSVFNGQRAIRSSIARFVPNYSNYLISYGVSDPKRFIKELGSVNKLASNFGGEVALFSINQEQAKYIAIVALEDEPGASLDSGSYEEVYSGYEIRSLRKQPLEQAFSQLIPIKSFEYFTEREKFVFLANEPTELKLMIDAIEADDTWGKSIAFQKFYQRGLQESNVSIIFREPTLSIANQKWEPLLDSLRLSRLSWASIQFSALDNHFYTSVNLALPIKEEKSTDQIKLKLSYRLPNVIDRGFAVKNYITGGSEVILQDSTFKIHLFNPADAILWQSQLDGMIQNISQIDYYKNNKLQYLISTQSSLYLIDRLGRDVEGFPRKLLMLVNSMELVDYDKSRNYRYIIQSSNSDVYILDKDGKPLEGWSPNHFPFSIKDKPKHYRIGGKDYFLMLSVDGFIYLVNRKGEVEKKIPLTYKSYLGDYVLGMGTNLATTFIQYVSSDGVVYKQSLDGKSSSQENLIKGNGSKFLLRRTAAGSADFFFFRMDTDKVAIFDKQQQLVIERQNPGSSQLIPSVVRLTDKTVIFCFYDLEQKLFFLYDQVGNLIGNRPIESTRAPIFGSDSKGKKFVVYSIDSDVLTSTPLN
jgi:hypothetical protein